MKLKHAKVILIGLVLFSSLITADFLLSGQSSVQYCNAYPYWTWGCSNGCDGYNYCYDMCEALPPDCDVMCCDNVKLPPECWYYCW